MVALRQTCYTPPFLADFETFWSLDPCCICRLSQTKMSNLKTQAFYLSKLYGRMSMYELQTRWKLTENALTYYGLRNAPNLFKNKLI